MTNSLHPSCQSRNDRSLIKLTTVNKHFLAGNPTYSFLLLISCLYYYKNNVFISGRPTQAKYGVTHEGIEPTKATKGVKS